MAHPARIADVFPRLAGPKKRCSKRRWAHRGHNAEMVSKATEVHIDTGRVTLFIGGNAEPHAFRLRADGDGWIVFSGARRVGRFGPGQGGAAFEHQSLDRDVASEMIANVAMEWIAAHEKAGSNPWP